MIQTSSLGNFDVSLSSLKFVTTSEDLKELKASADKGRIILMNVLRSLIQSFWHAVQRNAFHYQEL